MVRRERDTIRELKSRTSRAETPDTALEEEAWVAWTHQTSSLCSWAAAAAAWAAEVCPEAEARDSPSEVCLEDEEDTATEEAAPALDSSNKSINGPVI